MVNKTINQYPSINVLKPEDVVLGYDVATSSTVKVLVSQITALVSSAGSGPQGPQGPQGPEGPQGPQGVAGPQNLFVQNATPTFTGPALWVQTSLGLSGTDFTIWINE
jgi:hypothetical protein